MSDSSDSSDNSDIIPDLSEKSASEKSISKKSASKNSVKKSGKLKVGIVLNYKKAELKKEELLNVNSKKMPWLALAKEEKYKSHVIVIKKSGKARSFVAADVAIGIYLESHYPSKVEVDYITPPEISTRRFKKNDIVFVIIYDLLEAFHLSDKKIFYSFKNALKNSSNVYPPYAYQKFVNNKCNYYTHLAQKGVPVAPTYCITREKWYSKSPTKFVTNLLARVKAKHWDSIIAKPVYGQEAIGFAKFMECQDHRGKLEKYLAKNVPKYKSIVIQQYIPGFDKNKPEIRTYFVDGKYVYSVVTTESIVGQVKQEGGKYALPQKEWEHVLKLAKKTMATLPKLELKGQHKHPILTRIDIGSGLEDTKHSPYGYFVNEVEFVPSLYIEDQDYPVVQKIAKSLYSVAKEYRQRDSAKVNVLF